jgi:hypothetical protein
MNVINPHIRKAKMKSNATVAWLMGKGGSE